MQSRLRKLLLPLLKAVKEGRPISFKMRSAASQAAFLIGKGTSKQKGPSARLKRSSEKRKSHAEETAKIREAVMDFNDGRCSACGWGAPLELDHWAGGSGRRRERQSFWTCWALCEECHRRRTENLPSVEFWNSRWRAYCAVRASIRGWCAEGAAASRIQHVVHEPIARKAQ